MSALDLRSVPSVDLLGRTCSAEHPPLIVAELSGNHGGDLGRALALVDAAAEAGADAVKLQTYRPDTITIDHDGPEFLIEGGLWAGRRLYELYEDAHTPWEWHEALFERAAHHDLPIFSAPFDPTALDFLESLDCPAYKIASFELVDLPLIERVAATGKPVVVSTGMATFDEIDNAADVLSRYPDTPWVLLHCTSGYPTPIDEADLRTLPALAQRYGVPVGLSDHSTGLAAAVAATALGASLIEKHLVLDGDDNAVDGAFSSSPSHLAALAATCREAHRALGSVRSGPSAAERSQRRFRRSLYVVADVAAGEVITEDHVRSVRPGNGLAPEHLSALLGRRAARDLRFGEPMSADMIASVEVIDG